MMAADTLRLTEKLSYGLGEFAYALPWNLVGAFLLYYYTDVAQLPVAAVGTLFLTARLFDAAIDIGVGIRVDKTRSRWGRTRPYFLITGPLFCIAFVATFLVPGGWSDGARLTYAAITFYILGVLFSFGSVPLSALLPMMTADPNQRMQLSSWRAGLSAASVIVATAGTLPLVGALGGTSPQRGFAILAAIFAAVALALILNLARSCHERFHDRGAPGFPILPAVRHMLRNRAWVVTFLFAALNFIRFGAILSVTAFFAIEVLRQPWTISVLLPAVSGTLVLGAVIAPPIFKRAGMRRGCLGALALAIALTLALPWFEGRAPVFLAIFVIASLSVSVTMTGIYTMAADAVDWHEWHTGTRNEGLLSSGISLATKVGMAFGTAGIAYTLAAAGYHSGSASGGAIAAIRWSYYGWPLAIYSLQALCISFWPMDGQHARIRAEISARGLATA